MNPYLSAAIAALGAIVVGYFGLVANRARLRSDSGNARIDQYQEDLAAMRAERVEDRKQAADQRSDDLARTARLERIVRTQGDYIGELRKHIADGKPPPPPPFPQGLIT